MQSESIVQAALDRASVGRTTFIVAHRLSTIRNADKIIVIDCGRVKEIGTHEELMSTQGLYFHLVKTQQQSDDETKDLDNDMQNGTEKRMVTRAFSLDSQTDADLFSNRRKSSLKIKEKDGSPSLIRLMRLLKPDKIYVIIGSLTSFLMGLSIPAFALIFGEILGTLSNTLIDEIQKEVAKYSLLFVAMGVGSGVASFLQVF
jgi:ABC-type multidrug transport system fused ATPase/permease subunit